MHSMVAEWVDPFPVPLLQGAQARLAPEVWNSGDGLCKLVTLAQKGTAAAAATASEHSSSSSDGEAAVQLESRKGAAQPAMER